MLQIDSSKTVTGNLTTLIQGDCLGELKKIPDDSIDMIFADPPYNLQLDGELYRPNQTKVDAVDDEWDKFASFDDYDQFCTSWLKECRRVLKKDGSIWVIGSYHNIFRIGKIMQDIGLWILNDILWIKTNPMPNFKGTRFNNAHETLIWASKDKKSKYTFNYKSMKSFNDDKQMRSDWYIPICSGSERIYTNGQKAHSTQKPEALLFRIILSSSNVNDVILDPFTGSGTTGAVAKKLRRNFIGIEKEKKYIDVATDRINKVVPLDEKYLKLDIEKPKPKVPFGNLIENGYIEPGETIFSKDKKVKASVLSNGTVKYNDLVGSIHSISAKILNKDTNNGWDYWYLEKKGKLISIDNIRHEFAEQYLDY